MLVLISFLLIIACSGSSADCDFPKCYNEMKQALKLEVSQPWNDPEMLRPELEMYYKTADSLDGIRKLCKAFRNFRSCMGTNYRSCMTPASVAALGVNSQAAYEFVSVFSQLHYSCGAGLNVFVNSASCMKTTWNNSGRELDQALIDFRTMAIGDSKNACLYGSKMLTGFSRIFFRDCNKRSAREVEFWGCEYARTYVFNRYPECALSCSFPTAGGTIG